MTTITTFPHSPDNFSWSNLMYFSVILIVGEIQDLKMAVVETGQFP